MSDPRVDIFNIERQDGTVTELRVLQGGKEPPTSGENWLDRLPIGTVFWAQSKTNPMDFVLKLFRIHTKEGKVITLQAIQIQENIPVNSTRFCNNYLLYEQVGVIMEPTDGGNRVERDERVPDEEVERPAGE